MNIPSVQKSIAAILDYPANESWTTKGVISMC